MKTAKKALTAMLALALGIMLFVPALAVQPRIKQTKCACGGTISIFTTKRLLYTEIGVGTVYEATDYASCDSCDYNYTRTYTIIE